MSISSTKTPIGSAFSSPSLKLPEVLPPLNLADQLTLTDRILTKNQRSRPSSSSLTTAPSTIFNFTPYQHSAVKAFGDPQPSSRAPSIRSVVSDSILDSIENQKPADATVQAVENPRSTSSVQPAKTVTADPKSSSPGSSSSTFERRPRKKIMSSLTATKIVTAKRLHEEFTFGRKRPRIALEPTFLYPDIPEDVRDNEQPWTSMHGFSGLRLIPRLEQLSASSQHASRAEASFALSVNESNERFIRTFHRSLEKYSNVWVFEDVFGGQIVWVVSFTSQDMPPDTHAAGRPIHLVPQCEYPAMSMADSAVFPPADPIRRTINLRRMLTAEDLIVARRTFPDAVGIRVLIAGWVIILFRTRSQMKLSWTRKNPTTFGERRIAYEVLNHTPTTAIDCLEYGTAVARAPNAIMKATGCLGLALTLPNGEEAITTPTHCFVDLPQKSFLRTIVEKAYSSFWQMFVGPPKQSAPAVVRTTGRRSGGAVGRDVWLVSANTKVSRSCGFGNLQTNYIFRLALSQLPTIPIHLPSSDTRQGSGMISLWSPGSPFQK